METAALVISIVTLVGGILTPIIISLAYFIKNIKESDCCGGKIVLNTPPIEKVHGDLEEGITIQKK